MMQEELANLRNVANGQPPSYDWWKRQTEFQSPSKFDAIAALNGSLAGWSVRRDTVSRILFNRNHDVNII